MKFRLNWDMVYKMPATYTVKADSGNYIYVNDPNDPVDIVEKKLINLPEYKEAMALINKVKQ